MPDYPPPLDRLLTIGDVWRNDGPGTPDYLALGVGREHVADLLRMVMDEELYELDYETDPAAWGRYHALHALGALRAEESLGPLALLYRLFELEDDEWGMETLPDVVAAFGPAALPVLERLLESPERADDSYALNAVTETIGKIGRADPSARDAAVAVLARTLDAAEQNHPTLNGFLISELVSLEATEAAPAMERAFDADLVDEFFVGDKALVLHELGLGPPPPPSPRRSLFDDPYARTAEQRAQRPDPARLARQQKKKAKKRKRK